MKAAELHKIKEQLIEMRNRLADEINRMTDNVRTNVRDPLEHDRSPSESVDKEVRLEHTEESIRHLVNEALDRIESGTYGACQKCGARIPAARLAAIPYTPYCVNCEAESERD